MAAEQMKERGEKASLLDGKLKTQARSDWVLDQNCSSFNIRIVLISIFTLMKTVDTKLTIMSSIDSNTWKLFQAIPKGNEFTKTFDLCQEPTGKQKTCVQ
eukprot:13609509-Ditylum_brightwellii.AAC.1